MKFIKIDFPSTLFLPEGKLNSFYEDVPSSEKVKASGLFLPPVFPELEPQDRRDMEGSV